MKRELLVLCILTILAFTLALVRTCSAAPSNPLAVSAVAVIGAIEAVAFLVHRRQLIPLLIRE
jgi:hypothetical protein